MSMTAQELIKAAMRVSGIVASGETPSSDEMADGLEALKIMLRGWSAEGLPVEILTEIEHTLTAGDPDYTIGAAGCDITSDWPVEIISGYVRSSESLDSPLEIISEQQYDEIPIKTTGGTPSRLFYNPTYPNGTLYLYYSPESAMTMFLKAITLMDEPAALATEITFPPYYDEPIKWNLAIMIGAEFGREPSQTVVAMAIHSKATIEARNALTRTEPIRVQINKFYRNFSINEG